MGIKLLFQTFLEGDEKKNASASEGSQDTGQDPLLLGERWNGRHFTSERGTENCLGPQKPTPVSRERSFTTGGGIGKYHSKPIQIQSRFELP